MLTRRQLLAHIGLTSGTAAMYRALALMGVSVETADTIAASRSALGAADRRLQVLCIGGGIAGLVAGYELKRQGIAFEVHEARPVVGGRCETIRGGDVVIERGSEQVCAFADHPDFYFNSGPSRIPHRHSNIMSYCRELGVALEVFINENRSALVYNASLGDKPYPRAQLAGSVRGHFAEIVAKHGAQLSEEPLSQADQEEITRLARMFGDLDRSLSFKGSLRLGAEYGPGKRPEILPPVPLATLTKLGWSELSKLFYYERLHQQAPMFQPVGGMDNIAKAFAQPIADHIVTESVLTRIRTLPSGKVEAIFSHDGEERRKEADTVIFTMQPSVFPHIDHDLSDDLIRALKRVHLYTSSKVAFQAPRFWERQNIYGGGSSTDEDISQIWYPSQGIGQEQGILIGAYNLGLDSRNTFYKKSPEKRISVSINQGEKIHPGYSEQVSHGVSRSWPLTPYIQGGFAAGWGPKLLQERHGPYLFAGDYTSYLPGWQEGAILSAHRTLAHLGSGTRFSA